MKILAQMVFVVALLIPSAGWAQQKGSIAIVNRAEVAVVKTDAAGHKATKLVEAAKASVGPGDTVIFTSTYTNTGKQPATGVVITNPVPANMTYTDRSAEGRDCVIEFSIDGGKTYDAPGKLTVKDHAGKSRPAAASDYTGIRWTLMKALAAGSAGNVSFRAVVR